MEIEEYIPDAEDTFKAIILVETALGLCRSDRKTVKNFSKSWLRKGISFILILYATCTGLDFVSELKYGDVAGRSYLVDVIYSLLVVITLSYLELIDIFWNKNLQLQIFTALHIIDHEIENRAKAIIFLKSKICVGILLLSMIFINLGFFTMDSFIMGLNYVLSNFYSYVCYFLMDLEMCYLAILQFNIQMRLELVNRHLEKIFKTSSKTPETDSRMNENRENFQLFEFYKEMLKVYQCTIDSFKYQFSFFLSVSICSTITFIDDMFEAFKEDIFKPLYKYHLTLWAFHYLVPLTLACIFSEQAKDEFQKAKYLLAKIKCVAREGQHRLVTDILKLLDAHEMDDLPACNLFHIRASLLLSYTGLLTQYVIVYIQLRGII